MTRNVKILWLIVVILVVAVAGLCAYLLRGRIADAFTEPGYYAVYLQSGEIYFGKLHHFPRLTLTDVYFLLKNTNGDGYSLSKFANAVYGPTDELRLNEKSVLWISPLSATSSIISQLQK